VTDRSKGISTLYREMHEDLPTSDSVSIAPTEEHQDIVVDPPTITQHTDNNDDGSEATEPTTQPSAGVAASAIDGSHESDRITHLQLSIVHLEDRCADFGTKLIQSRKNEILLNNEVAKLRQLLDEANKQIHDLQQTVKIDVVNAMRLGVALNEFRLSREDAGATFKFSQDLMDSSLRHMRVIGGALGIDFHDEQEFYFRSKFSSSIRNLESQIAFVKGKQSRVYSNFLTVDVFSTSYFRVILETLRVPPIPRILVKHSHAFSSIMSN
jgi:hypothetical protein